MWMNQNDWKVGIVCKSTNINTTRPLVVEFSCLVWWRLMSQTTYEIPFGQLLAAIYFTTGKCFKKSWVGYYWWIFYHRIKVIFLIAACVHHRPYFRHLKTTKNPLKNTIKHLPYMQAISHEVRVEIPKRERSDLLSKLKEAKELLRRSHKWLLITYVAINIY